MSEVLIKKGVFISEIKKVSQLITPAPTVSDKDSADMAVKLRYLIDVIEAARRKVAYTRAITAPSPNTAYYLPAEPDWIDLTEHSYLGFLVYTPDGDALTLQLQFSDGEDIGDLVGFALPSANYVIGSWNNIFVPEGAGLGRIRLKATTGAVAPSRIKLIAFARGI